MNRRLVYLAVIGAAAVAIAIVVLLQMSPTNQYLNPERASAVDIVNGSSVANQTRNFYPHRVIATLGLTNKIIWTNHDLVHHTVVSDNGYSNTSTGTFKSDAVAPSQTYEYTFAEKGTYDYHCDIHPWMHGQIEVLEFNMS